MGIFFLSTRQYLISEPSNNWSLHIPPPCFTNNKTQQGPSSFRKEFAITSSFSDFSSKIEGFFSMNLFKPRKFPRDLRYLICLFRKDEIYSHHVRSDFFSCLTVVVLKTRSKKHIQQVTNDIILPGTNISHLGKRKIIFKSTLGGDLLVPRRVYRKKTRFANNFFGHDQETCWRWPWLGNLSSGKNRDNFERFL